MISAKVIGETGLLTQVFLLVCLFAVSEPPPAVMLKGGLPDLLGMDLLTEEAVSEKDPASAYGILVLSPSCTACKQLVTSLTNSYHRMEMNITGILVGDRSMSLDFVKQIGPPFAVYHTTSLGDYDGNRITRFPYIIITDSLGNVTKVSASEQDLY